MIAVQIDTTEMDNGSQVGDRLRGGAGAEIPWSVILDADGNELMTSDGPDGNIGFPSSEGEITYFMEMLRVSRPSMKPDVADALRESLNKYAKDREF